MKKGRSCCGTALFVWELAQILRQLKATIKDTNKRFCLTDCHVDVSGLKAFCLADLLHTRFLRGLFCALLPAEGDKADNHAKKCHANACCLKLIPGCIATQETCQASHHNRRDQATNSTDH